MEENKYKPLIRIESEDLAYQINHNYFANLNAYKLCTSFVDIDEYLEAVTNGFLPGGHIPGDTLIKSPYDNKYIAIQEYEATVMQDKANHIAEIARRLGAVYTKCSINLDRCSERQIKGNISADIKNMHANASWQQQEEKRLKGMYNLNQQFSAAEVPTEEIYRAAIDYAERHHLKNDSGTEILLNSREPSSHNNLLETQSVKVHLCTDLNTNLEIAAQLTERNDIFSFSNDFYRSVKIKKDVSLEIMFYFAVPGKDNNDIIAKAIAEIQQPSLI